MRIIRGKYKGRHIPTPTNFRARPTTDFAKEGLFNILENVYVDFDEEPKALDLFAGTGSIGLEFASRGCSKVVSVEKDFRHWQFLAKVQKELQAKEWIPLKGDVFKYVRACKEKYDIIFADPPYALENLKDIPDAALPLLAEDGLLILEHGSDYDFSQHPRCIDHRNYGSVNFTFFK
ncbi:MAG: RsmD family RNA methyltransferase [Prevotellaceae bacterium]|nr:RsmD family RNA methyltransferase [Candidatus Minthosoma equi]